MFQQCTVLHFCISLYYPNDDWISGVNVIKICLLMKVAIDSVQVLFVK